ncbi:type 1 glutamine amidotransferase domain-containing protein [Oxalobacteraceae bacterium R-40]|uniref:Type 1 glutamine amidotransferase domain-containing protein n=1 Tax=Keguizhuia sedimenti TaxID=3064264 RepID=A0ABU1BS85_9BURK|nr:type 1 glutamine amidotransferase domain-containing protein [Oxalobacteraceae bacterium R-40]
MDPQLNGMHIAILVTDGFEQVELTEPKEALEREGAMITIVSERHGDIFGFHHDVRGDRFSVDLTFDEAVTQDFDAVLLPGGHVNAGHLRHLEQAQQFIREIQNEGKPVAVICHGPWLLVSAGLVQGRTLTSWPSLQEEIRQAGGNWVDQEVVSDGNWVSSRKPDDIPAFNRAMIELIAERMRANLRGTADEHAVGIASS